MRSTRTNLQISLITSSCFFWLKLPLDGTQGRRQKAFFRTNETNLNSQILYKFQLFSVIASFSPSNFHRHYFVLKFQALASVIVSNQARKPSFETKRAKACCNPHPRITAAEINLGETAAFG